MIIISIREVGECLVYLTSCVCTSLGTSESGVGVGPLFIYAQHMVYIVHLGVKNEAGLQKQKKYKTQVVATCCKGLRFYNSLTLMLTISVELPLEQTDVIAKPTLNDSRYPDMFFFLRVLLSSHGVSRYIVHASALSLPSFTWLTALYYLTELHKWHQNNPRGHVLTCGCLSGLTVIECNAAADLPLMFDHRFGANIRRPRL